MQEQTFERWLTVKQVARMLQVNDNTVRRAIKQSKLKAINIGGTGGYRIDPHDLREYLESKKQGNRAAWGESPRPGRPAVRTQALRHAMNTKLPA